MVFLILIMSRKGSHCYGNGDWNCPPWPGSIVTICISYFMTGSPGEEHRTNKPPLTGRIRERSKGDAACPSTSQNPPCWHPSWLSNAWTIRKDPESEQQARDNPITIKPEVTSHVTGQFSWVPLPSYSAPPRCPFPIKSLACQQYVS